MVNKNKAGQIALNIIFICLVIFCVAPFLMLISSSLTSEKALTEYGYSFFPREISFDAYLYMFQSGDRILRAYGITIFITVVGTICNVLITVLFAYPLSRRETPCRTFFAFYMFFTMLFNGGVVPSYLMWTQTFHIKNTIFALIIPGLLMSAFNVILMRSYFTANVPNEIIEAARMDGAREFRILFGIIVPLSKPMMATIALMVGLRYWNDWTNSLYYINEEDLYSIQAILNNMLTNIQFLASNTNMNMDASMLVSLPSVGIRMAIAVVGVLPILIVYPFFQKYFVKGIVVGGIKG